MSTDSNDKEEVRLDASNKAERRTLKQVLGINMFQVVMAGTVGFIATLQVYWVLHLTTLLIQPFTLSACMP